MVNQVKIINDHKVIVIGETALCIECCKCVLALGWELLAVISGDELVVQWCMDLGITHKPFAQFSQLNHRGYLLFSIINSYIIPQEILQKHDVVLAINYHDSVLPAYAGLNSTTWALLNEEKNHGITWHKMVCDIDQGEVVAQQSIRTMPNETAQSLNLKCALCATDLFKSLLQDIATGKLLCIKQNLSLRTYYSRKHIPSNYGIVNALSTTDEIKKHCRALFFGTENDNPVTTVKLQVNKKFYIIDEQATSQEDYDMTINVGDHESVGFRNIKNCYGELDNSISGSVVLPESCLLTEQELNFLSELKLKESATKVSLLKLHKLIAVNRLLAAGSKGIALHDTLAYEALTISQVVSTICITLLKTFDQEYIVTCYESIKASEPLRHLVDTKSFIVISNNLRAITLAEFQLKLDESISVAVTITKDFFYRYRLRDLLTEIGIYIGKMDFDHPIRHRLILNIDERKVKIYGAESDQETLSQLSMSLGVLLKSFQNGLSGVASVGEIMRSCLNTEPVTASLNQQEKIVPSQKSAFKASNYTLDKMCEIWTLLLPNRTFALNDNFFDCGGNSILLAYLKWYIEKEFSIKLSSVDFFKYPTILAMAALVEVRLNNLSALDISNAKQV